MITKREFDSKKYRPCSVTGCSEAGLYPAPVSPSDWQSYQWMCLSHVRNFNKSWNYYASKPLGLLEHDIRARYVGDNPTWNVAHLPSHAFSGESFFDQSAKQHPSKPATPKKPDPDPDIVIFFAHTREQHRALEALNLSSPTREDKIGQQFRQIAKRLHPDRHQGATTNQRQSMESELQRASKAYAILKKACHEKRVVSI